MLSRIHLVVWGVVGAVMLVGCAQTDRVPVGSFGESIDVSACMGDDTRCGEDLPSPRRIDPEIAPTQCEIVEDEAWHVAWWRQTTGIRCAPVGYCDAGQMAVAGDGTVWTASVGSAPLVDSEETQFGLFLVHYDREGEILAEEVVEHRELAEHTPYHVAIAADARGHVFVAMVWTGEDAWLSEFDSRAQLVGLPVQLRGWETEVIAQPDFATDGSLLLLAQSDLWDLRPDLNSLAKLDSNLRPVWLQSALPPLGFQRLLRADRSLTLTGLKETEPGISNAVQVTRLNSAGMPVDLLELPLAFQPFAADRQGNVFSLLPNIEGPSVAIKLSREGELLFQVEVMDQRDPVDSRAVHQVRSAATPEGASFYAMHWMDERGYEVQEILTLWQLDPRGERCTVTNIVDGAGGPEVNLFRPMEMAKLIYTNAGELFFQTESAIGRLAR